MRSKTLVAWLAAGLCGLAQAQAQAPLDLLTLHERARQSAPQVRIAAAQRGEQQARLRAANSQLLPQLDAVWQRGGGNLAGRVDQGSLQLNQALFDAPRWQARDAAAQRLQAATAEQAASDQGLRQRSAQLFVQLHAQQQLLLQQQRLAAAYADEARRMGVRHREGLAAAVDWHQSQSFQWLAEANARGAAQQLRALRQALVSHVGDAALLDQALRPLGAQALPTALADEGQASPRRAAQQAELDARRADLAAARQSHWPALSLQAQAQRDLQSSPRQGHDWQLQLRIPIWDSGSRGAARDQAQQRLLAGQAELDQLERELKREHATQVERLLAAREQHATATTALEAAALTVSAMRVGQEQGSRSTSDVLLALQTEGQLRQLAVQAQADAWLAWIDGLVAQGRFDAAALQALNSQLE